MADWIPPEVAKGSWVPPEVAGEPVRLPALRSPGDEVFEGLKPYDEGEARLGGLKAAGKAVAVGAGQLVDMVNPAPMVTHLLSYIGNKKILQQEKGVAPHVVAAQSKAMADIASEWAGSGIFEKLAREATSSSEDTPITAVNEKISGFIKEIGRDYQSRTKGAVQAEDVEEMANVAMLGLMARVGGGKPKEQRPAAPKVDAAVDALLTEWVPPETVKPPPSEAKKFPALAKAGLVGVDGTPLLRQAKKAKPQLVDESGVPMKREAGVVDEKVLIALGVGGATAAVAVPIIQDYLEGRKSREAVEEELKKKWEFMDSPTPGTPKPEPKIRELIDEIDKRQPVMATLGVAALLAMSPKTPLKDIHPRLEYTTKVLTDLATSMPDKAVFTAEHVLQRANRPNVGKFEKEMFADIMKDRPTISAVDLAAEVKKRTGDFELRPQETDRFADYGLDALHDMRAGGADRAAPDATRTTIYQSPIHLGDANHFSDPNYFAHTRSFDKGGIRHVVEIQSDLAQKAGKALTAEERVKLETELQTAQDAWDLARKEAHPDDLRFGSARRVNELEVQMSELRLKLAQATSADPVRPMLKDWYKRIVREEIAEVKRGAAESAEAGRNAREAALKWQAELEQAKAQGHGYGRMGLTLEGVEQALRHQIPTELAEAARLEAASKAGKLRFATADTVAKVEGWPRVNPDRAELRQSLRNARDTYGPDSEIARSIAQELEAAVDAIPARFRPEHQSIYDRYRKDIETYLTKEHGGKPYTDEQGHTWIEVPLSREGSIAPKQMLGRSDHALLAYLAAVGGSAALAAYITKEDPKPDSHRKVTAAGVTAFLTAAAGLVLLRKSSDRVTAQGAADIVSGVERTIGQLAYQLEKISGPTARLLYNYDRQVMTKGHDRLLAATPWAETVRKLPETTRIGVTKELNSGNFKAAVAQIPIKDRLDFAKSLVAALKVVREIGDEAFSLGLIKEKLSNYFPRRVADYEGLMNYLGSKVRTVVELQIKKAAAKAGGVLDEAAFADALNTTLHNLMKDRKNLPVADNLKNRSLKEIDEGAAAFYEAPSEALISYITSMTSSIERARFFGKDHVKSPAGATNLPGSISQLFARDLASGKMTSEQFADIAKLLSVRFGPGEKAMHRSLRALSGVTSAALLANPFSAMMNFGDIPTNMAVHGLVPTAKAVASVITRRPQRYKTTDFGLADSISLEFTGGSSSPLTAFGKQVSVTKGVSRAFSLSGFSLVDLFGKEITLNAAVFRAKSLLSSAKGEARFAREQLDYFRDDLSALIDDLRAGRKTELTFEYAFREITDMHVVTRSQMPTNALANPNLRIMWQMKSWALNQLKLVRKKGVDEIRKGNVAGGMGFLLRYGAIVGVSQASLTHIVRSMLGHDEELEASDIATGVFQTVGVSQMVLERLKEGKLKEAVGQLVSPAATVVFDIATRPDEAYKHIPVVGRFLYKQSTDESGKTRAQRQDEAKKKRETTAKKKELERELGIKLGR